MISIRNIAWNKVKIELSWLVSYKFLQISSELVNNLLSGCVKCGAVLNITNIVSEKRRGLGSSLSVICGSNNCVAITIVDTGRMHGAPTDGRRTEFDVNPKLAAGNILPHVNYLNNTALGWCDIWPSNDYE